MSPGDAQVNRLAGLAIMLHCLLPTSWVPPLSPPTAKPLIGMLNCTSLLSRPITSQQLADVCGAQQMTGACLYSGPRCRGAAELAAGQNHERQGKLKGGLVKPAWAFKIFSLYTSE